MKGVHYLISFRPRNDCMGDFMQIQDWCKANNRPFSTVINSLLPAIAYALENNTVKNKDGLFVICDFGAVKLLRKQFASRD